MITNDGRSITIELITCMELITSNPPYGPMVPCGLLVRNGQCSLGHRGIPRKPSPARINPSRARNPSRVESENRMTTKTYPKHEVLDRYTVWSHLDNHEPAHEYFRGEITVLTSLVEPGAKVYELATNPAFMRMIESDPTPIFLLDDGETVQPLYVIGWPSVKENVWLQPFPVNPNGEKTRPDVRVVDYRSWALGPRVAYHLKRD